MVAVQTIGSVGVDTLIYFDSKNLTYTCGSFGEIMEENGWRGLCVGNTIDTTSKGA